MGKYEKILADVMSGKCDHNIHFDDLRYVIEHSGFIREHISGSHHIYSFKDVVELIDIQPDKNDHSMAKAYQVKQVRKFFDRYLEV